MGWIPAFINNSHAIARTKIMIIVKESVITGSFNFTKAAVEKNDENLLVIKNRDLVKIYMDNWYTHKAHSVLYG